MKLKLLTLSAGIMLANSALAAEDKPYSIFATTGQYYYDEETDIDNDMPVTFGIGYQFAPRWGGEFSYTNITSETETNPALDTDAVQFQLDGLYHFGDLASKWKPYVVGGLGNRNLEVGRVEGTNTYFNFGLGTKYAVSEMLQLRGDVRGYNDVDDSYLDYGFNLGLAFVFGSASTSSKPAPVAAAPVAAVDKDTDGDGVFDSADKCPTTPEGVAVDYQGCALDSDNDGVADYKDECAETKAQFEVDEKGCPTTLTETITASLEVKFENNSDAIKSEFTSPISELAKFMTEFADTSVVIHGYTDDRGSEAYNRSLSQKRADKIKQVLVETYKIDASRIEAIGHGEDNPIADNNTAEGRAENRRVDAEISSSVSRMKEKAQ